MADTIKNHKRVKKFKCYDCGQKYTALCYLIKHVEKEHKDKIPKGMSTKQYIFNKSHKKDYQLCVICKKNKTAFNEQTMRYNRYCSEACRKKAGEIANANLKKKTGKDRSERMSDPDTQKGMLANRKTSGIYTFSNGKTTIGYASSYELEFLKFYDLDFGGDPLDIMECPYSFEYEMDNAKHTYIPDYYIPSANLIIEIKWEKQDNEVHDTERKEPYREDAVRKSGKFNYIKIRGTEYTEFVQVMSIIKERNLDTTGNYDPLFITSYAPKQ